MRSKRTLKPGDPGTQKFLHRYGDALVCVRYRYDVASGTRVTTVELVVDTGPWKQNRQRIPHNKTVQIRVDYAETQVRSLVKKAGGKWNPEKRVWELPYGEVKQLGLTERIVEDQ